MKEILFSSCFSDFFHQEGEKEYGVKYDASGSGTGNEKKIRFQNAERLDLGVILPDAAVDGNSHLKRSICGGQRYV